MLANILKKLDDLKERMWQIKEYIETNDDLNAIDKEHLIREYTELYRNFIYFTEEVEDLEAAGEDDFEDKIPW